LWVKHELDPLAASIHNDVAAFGGAYQQHGIRQLVRLSRFRNDYVEFVSALASQIVATADRHPLPSKRVPIEFHSISDSSIPSAFQEPVHRGILGIDIQGFGRQEWTDPIRSNQRRRLHRLLNQALARAEIAQSSTSISDLGDGLLLLTDATVSRVRLLHAVTALAAALAEDNRQMRAAERLRLRVVVHAGEILRDEDGFIGHSLVEAVRILDARVSRAILDAGTAADLVLLVSEQIYQEVVRHGYAGIDPASYQPIRVQNKETRARAWVHRPNQSARPDMARVGATVIERPGGGDFNQEVWPATGRTGAADITIVNDVVVGRDQVRSGDLARRSLQAEAQLRVRSLPADVAGFIGRDKEVSRLQNLLTRSADQADATGAYVIAGMAGVGKSALAIHVAHQVASEFPDGQLYVDLSGADDRHLDMDGLLAELLRTLGVADEAMPKTPKDRAALYQALLAERRVLLVLDDVESLAEVRRLLPTSKGASKVLVTSRTPKAALDKAAHVHLGRLGHREAVALLRSFGGRKDLPETVAQQLAASCDYLPLALHLASARLNAQPELTADELIEGLVEARHRWEHGGQTVTSLGEAVAANFTVSYAALGTVEARTFRLLGLLDRSAFGVESIAALSGESIGATRASLQLLERVGLVQPASVPGRYQLHDQVRAFARLHLEAEEPEHERRRALTRLVEWYLSTGAAAAERLQPDYDPKRLTGERFSSREAALAWLDAECVNLTSMIEQAATVARTSYLPELAGYLFAYYTLRRRWQDAERTYEQALRAARDHGNRIAEARLLNNLAAVLHEQRRFEDSLTCLEQSLTICRELGDRQGERLGLVNLGVVYQERQDHDSALACLQEGLRIAREIQDRSGESQALTSLGNVYRDQGRLAEAMEYYQLGVAAARGVGDHGGEAIALANLGIIAEGSVALPYRMACRGEAP
jgi:tetratricopeptide (TPR) repeat protein